MGVSIKKIKTPEIIYSISVVLFIGSQFLPYYIETDFQYWWLLGGYVILFINFFYLGIPAVIAITVPIFLIHQVRKNFNHKKVIGAVLLAIIGCGLIILTSFIIPEFYSSITVSFEPGTVIGIITLFAIFLTSLRLLIFAKINLEAIVSKSIANLSSIYYRLTFKQVASQIGISSGKVQIIIEDMIMNGDLKAQITKDTLIFKNDLPSSLPQTIDIKDTIEEGKGMRVFLSYSTLDTDYFHISDIANMLESYPEIDRVLYWEADSGVNIVEYMERTLKECNVFILFCTENSWNSRAVTDEWQAAFQLRKKDILKIFPVYEDERFIPALLTPLLNVKFPQNSFNEFMTKLYQEILRE